MKQAKFAGVLFDCDGVLVDSELITNRVLCEMLNQRGWAISLEETMKVFLGKAVKDEADLISHKTGQIFDKNWLSDFSQQRNLALKQELQAIPHIHTAMQDIALAYGKKIACASGADKPKVQMQLEKVSLIQYFEDRIFSGHDMPRSKPYPDVYCAAAKFINVNPSQCAVVEDSVTGVMAGVASGATVFAYTSGLSHTQSSQALLEAGASVCFSSMLELAALLCS